MPKQYLNLDFPAGMFANGTEYSNRNLWVTGDRIRWHNNALRPIGGWQKFLADDPAVVEDGPQELDQIFADPTTEAARAQLSWQTNLGLNVHVVGTNLGIYAFDKQSTTVFTITPAGFTPRAKDVSRNDGYGSWYYGRSTYGTPRPTDEDPIGAFNWVFRTWGENLLAAERQVPSALYEWAPNFGVPAAIIPNAPTNFNCMHVTDQRIVMVAGSTNEPRLVQWSDSENNNLWAPALQNQAGFQTLPGIGEFKEIVTVQDQILLISETDAYVAKYVGPPYIFSFDKAGENCGVEAGAAVIATENFAMWPSGQDFFIFDGSSVRRMDCPVMDVLRSAVNTPQGTKTVGFVNKEWGEIWWLFQSGMDEVDSYIFYDIKDRHWTTGTLDRTVGYGEPALDGPIMIGSDGYAYEHELEGVVPSDNDLASDAFVESGPIEIAKGNMTQYIDSIQPDFLGSGSVNITLKGQDRPSAPIVDFGPYLVDYPALTQQPVPCRARGHTIRVRIEGSSSTWTSGSMRLNYSKPGGMK